MTAKTSRGKYRKEITGIGTQSILRWIERQMGIRKVTKTEEKQKRKAQERLKDVHKFP